MCEFDDSTCKKLLSLNAQADPAHEIREELPMYVDSFGDIIFTTDDLHATIHLYNIRFQWKILHVKAFFPVLLLQPL